MKKVVLDFTYTELCGKTLCALTVSSGDRIKELTGEVSIPKALEYHVLGHAIRQLLADKYGFEIACVFKPLDNDLFKKSEITGLHIERNAI